IFTPSRKSVLDLLIFFKLARSGLQINYAGIVTAGTCCKWKMIIKPLTSHVSMNPLRSSAARSAQVQKSTNV
ncbi:hypothetical protein PanWU01x14_343180, partial [Parasponia andersonii]